MKKEKIFHQPVLLKETIDYLNPKPKENFIDATFGFGGHGKAILEKNWPKGKLLGIEIDPAATESRAVVTVGWDIATPESVLLEPIIWRHGGSVSTEPIYH